MSERFSKDGGNELLAVFNDHFHAKDFDLAADHLDEADAVAMELFMWTEELAEEIRQVIAGNLNPVRLKITNSSPFMNYYIRRLYDSRKEVLFVDMNHESPGIEEVLDLKKQKEEFSAAWKDSWNAGKLDDLLKLQKALETIDVITSDKRERGMEQNLREYFSKVSDSKGRKVIFPIGKDHQDMSLNLGPSVAVKRIIAPGPVNNFIKQSRTKLLAAASLADEEVLRSMMEDFILSFAVGQVDQTSDALNIAYSVVASLTYDQLVQVQDLARKAPPTNKRAVYWKYLKVILLSVNPNLVLP